jgi:RNA polymerase sigma factor (sigma-70 family)
VTETTGETNSPSGIDVAAREAELKERMVRSLDGDAAAYDALLRLLVPQLRAFFRRRVQSDDVTEDLVQETLIAVHTKRSTYDRARPFTAWLYAIARYKLADHFRQSYRVMPAEDLDDAVAAPDFEAGSMALIDVERLLDGLPAKQQTAIRATKIEGLSLSEVAAVAGISQSDAKMSVYRGLKRLSSRVQGKIR